MIKKLNHSNQQIAHHIFQVFQSSYKIEADLIGVDEFPPLNRSVSDISQSGTQFYGFYMEAGLAAVIEVETNKTNAGDKALQICSLTVDPSYFRKGIAGQLIEYVCDLTDITEYEVETAVVNQPAIMLYQKHGFVEVKTYVPAHGIPKVVMRKVK